MSQSGKDFTMVHDKESYLNDLTKAVTDGMAVAISFWGNSGSGMSWLDVPPCDIQTNCATEGKMAVFGDIIVS